MKKIFSIVLLLVVIFTFEGCSTLSHSIPRGEYVSNDGTPYDCTLREQGNNYDYFWKITNNEAHYYVSGWLDYKSKIVEKDGKIYFEGYVFRNFFDFLSGRESGDTDKYEVEYDDETKTLFLIKI